MATDLERAALDALRELVRVKNDRNNHWPLSQWLTWNTLDAAGVREGGNG